MATRERGVLRAKAAPSGSKATVDIGSLLQVTADDIAEEITAVKKNKARIEKNNERLEEQEKKLLEQEDKWTKEIATLETTSRTTISQLEEKINKTKFDWTRDRAADDRELERLNQKLDTIENELESKQDKREAKQLAEINALKEELAALENSGAEQVTNLGRLENLFAQLQDDKKKATEEGQNLKREIETNTKSLEMTGRELATYEESLGKSTEKDEASRADLQARNELEEAITAVKKEIKAAQKANESDKKELGEMNEVRDQLEAIKRKNDALTEEIEKLKENLEKEKSEASKNSGSSDAGSSSVADSGTDDKPVLSADTGAEKKSDAERQIEELEIELKRVEFEWNEKKASLDEKLADLKSEEERVKASIARLQNDTKTLEKDLTTARDNFTKDSREKADGLRQAQGETTTLDREIDKIQKDLDKQNSRDQAGKRTLQEKKFELLQTEQSVQAQNFVLGFLTQREQKIEAQQKDYAEKIRVAKINLKDTEDKLKTLRDQVAELNETMRDYIKRNEALVEKFAEECFKEMGATEALTKQRESLRAEIARLRAYMSRDSIGLDTPDAKEDMYTAAIEKIVEERRKEMAAISKQLRGNKTKDERSLQDLTNDWARLVKEKEAYWDATSEYFVNIIGLLKQLPISKIETFQIPLYLLENDVAAGVLIEIGVLLKLQRDGQLSNLLQSASYNIKQAFRDVKSGEVTDEDAAAYKHSKYSHALLKRLATLRSTMSCRRVNGHLRIYEYCMFAIMEGEEDWEEEEYQNFIEEEEKLNQAKINAANEAKKKYAEEKAHWAKKREEKAVRGGTGKK